MFSGLYSTDSRQNIPEPYPIGTAVTIPNQSTTSPCYVLAVPSNSSPTIDSMYTIQLLDGTTTTVPESSMSDLVKTQSTDIKITLPPWMTHDAKVRYTVGRVTHQGRLHLNPDNLWSFVVYNKLGTIIKIIPLSNLPFTFHTLLTEGTLQPGWDKHPQITACNVSAKHLVNPCPSTLTNALLPDNHDRDTWHKSYAQEYLDLKKMEVYDEITTEQYHKIQHKCGKAIPTMCLLTIKYKDGYPDRAKCRIVVLGNQQQQTYSKGEKYAPVLTQNQFRCLLSLAIKQKRRLRQGYVKNAFCNSCLPDNEVVVI